MYAQTVCRKIHLRGVEDAVPYKCTCTAVYLYFEENVNAQCGTNLFQRSYYDHVIRGERDYQMIWEYIETNPAKWHEDELYIE